MARLPCWLHLIPSCALLVAGAALGVLAWFGVTIGPATLGSHTLLVAVVLILLGYKALMFALFAHTFAWRENLAPASPFLENFYRFAGARPPAVPPGGDGRRAADRDVFWTRRGLNYGNLPYPVTLRQVVPGVLLIALAAQTFFDSFVISLASLERK